MQRGKESINKNIYLRIFPGHKELNGQFLSKQVSQGRGNCGVDRNEGEWKWQPSIWFDHHEQNDEDSISPRL